jgi:hypothetical protein
MSADAVNNFASGQFKKAKGIAFWTKMWIGVAVLMMFAIGVILVIAVCTPETLSSADDLAEGLLKLGVVTIKPEHYTKLQAAIATGSGIITATPAT